MTLELPKDDCSSTLATSVLADDDVIGCALISSVIADPMKLKVLLVIWLLASKTVTGCDDVGFGV